MSNEAQRCYAPDGQASAAGMQGPVAARAPSSFSAPLLNLHDRTQFELKVRYVPAAGRKRTRYRIETYLFVPKSFGLAAHTYGPDKFYGDLHTWSRFNLPPIGFPELLNASNVTSPLARLETLLRLPQPLAGSRAQEAGRELRLVGCAASVAVRRTMARLAQDHARDLDGAERIMREARAVCAGVRSLLLALRACAPRLAEVSALRAVCNSVQEHLQSSLEDQLTFMLDQVDRRAAEEGLAQGAVRSELAALLIQAASWRLGTPEASPNDDETFFHRRSLRKKYMFSALFLEHHKTPERRRTHVLSGFAAAVAMLFAAWAATVAQRLYDLDSTAFTLTVVGSYVIKDRIKEWVKTYCLRKAKAWPWDYNVELRDPHTGRTAGTCRETFGFAQPHRLPTEVRDERAAHDLAGGIQDLDGEVVLRYAKEVSLRAMPQDPFHGVHEVIRFNVARFLDRTDDPIRTLRWFDAEQHAVTRVQCPRIYHVHVVVVLQPLNGAATRRVESVRLVLDKTGIRRLLRPEQSNAP